jgi:hypothetical protein
MEGGPSVALREGAGTSLLAMIQGAGSSFRTSRAAALQVPAFVDAMKTYSHTIAGFPMRTYRGGEPIETAQVLVSPSSYLPYTSVIARTVENLLLHDRAYWLVVDRTWDGFPREVQVMDVDDVSDLTTHSTANQNTPVPARRPVLLHRHGSPGPRRHQVLRRRARRLADDRCRCDQHSRRP